LAFEVFFFLASSLMTTEYGKLIWATIVCRRSWTVWVVSEQNYSMMTSDLRGLMSTSRLH